MTLRASLFRFDMLDFTCDYNNGAHPSVLQRLIDTNGLISGTYGFDEFSESAADKIRAAVEDPGAAVYFIAGGTQTNMTVISSCLKSYEGVVCADTGHINCHESGAVEYTGHKIIRLPSHAGKVDAGELEDLLSSFYADQSHEHMVYPGMLYISYPTEYGTIYSKTELQALRGVCVKYGMKLFCDGARLGYGLCSDGADITLPELHGLCDVMYIGGTKCGALCGEAVVFQRGAVPDHFVTLIKQRGAMLAKGRLIGVQFDALFEDGLYFRIANQAIRRANELRALLDAKGYSQFVVSPSNQIFVVLDDETVKRLSENVKFEIWEKPDKDRTVMRFVTSWSTTPEQIAELGRLL